MPDLRDQSQVIRRVGNPGAKKASIAGLPAPGSRAEMGRCIQSGIDGFFTGDPAIGRRAIMAAGG